MQKYQIPGCIEDKYQIPEKIRGQKYQNTSFKNEKYQNTRSFWSKYQIPENPLQPLYRLLDYRIVYVGSSIMIPIYDYLIIMYHYCHSRLYIPLTTTVGISNMLSRHCCT